MARRKERRNRANGQGTLQKNGKYWLARWTVDGKHYSKSTHCTLREDAEKKLAEFVRPYQAKTEIERLENIEAKIRVQQSIVDEANLKAKPDKPIRLRFAVDTYIEDLNTSSLTENSEQGMRSVFRVLERETKCTFAHEVDEEKAKAFLEWVQKTCTASSYNTYLVRLKAVWKVIMKHDNNIKSNPWQQYKHQKIDKSLQRRELSEDELNKLLEVASNEKYTKETNGECMILFALGMFTGMRLSDCAECRWSSIDFNRKVLNIIPKKTRKNGKHAIIPLHSTLLKMLQDHKKTQAESSLVIPLINDKLKRNTLHHLVKHVFEDAGIETCQKHSNGSKHILTGFHSLRVSFASMCMRQGMPLNQVMTMLGHTSPDMSLHYTRTEVQDLQAPSMLGSKDEEHISVSISKSTYELLMKAKGDFNLDDYLKQIIQVKQRVVGHTYRDL